MGSVRRQMLTLLLIAVLTLASCTWQSGGQSHVATMSAMHLPELEIGASATILGQRSTASGSEIRVQVTIKNAGTAPLSIQASDFTLLSSEGDSFGQNNAPSPTRAFSPQLGPGSVTSAVLTFLAPPSSVAHGCLLYHHPRNPVTMCVGLQGSSSTREIAPQPYPDLHEYKLDGGVGIPWDTTTDAAGNIWFTEPGCTFAPACPLNAQPGEIGELNGSTHALRFYQLPATEGNQPLFLTFDPSGHIWFTTPDNSMIGEFDPQAWKLIGQWQVIPDSGPWDLAFAQGRIWFTEFFSSGIGEFDPATHTFHDYATPTFNSHPYGIASDPTNSDRLWFTENDSSVAQIGSFDVTSGKLLEYSIRATASSTLTPHLIVVDALGHPWWSEGPAHTLGTLDPALSMPGHCGASTGDCHGMSEYLLPPAPQSCTSTHVSGIAVQQNQLIWFDDSLSAQIGSFNPQTLSFTLYSLGDCSVHPHDGIAVDRTGHVWWDEAFLNAIGELS